MKVVYDKARVTEFLEERLHERLHEPYSVIGFERDGVLVAGFMFNGYNGTNVELTVAADHVLTRGMFRVLAAYAWEQLGAHRCTIHTSVLKPHVIDMAERIGWKIEGVHPLYYPDGSTAVSLGMLRAYCKW